MKKDSYLFLLAALLFMIYYCSIAAITTNMTTTDESALFALRSNFINLDPSHILYQNWSTNSSSSVCSWIGITCSRRHKRVIGLNISNMGLEGNLKLVPQLGNLSFLVSLDLSSNNFHGSLPQELTRLRRLRVLNLHRNDLGGGGTIPSWFGSSFPQLQILRLQYNRFIGIIPSSLSNISQLELLNLSDNLLHGEIPMEIGDTKNLQVLVLQQNQLTGPVPPMLFNISKLEILSLASNSLSGNLPDNICKGVQSIERLYLGDNLLSGSIPKNISSCSQLWWLDFALNKFSGYIPREIGNIGTLEWLNLDSNNLTGEVPVSLFNISTLQTIALGWNQLTGNIPPNLGHGLPNLETIQLSSNNFRCQYSELRFFTSLTNCRNLKQLGIRDNPLNGKLPSSIGNLSTLEYLYAQGSGIKGSIPQEIGNLSRLVTLTIFQNQLTGSLPESMGNLENLQAFDVWMNKIHGTIPTTMCKLLSLYSLVLSENQIGNMIPDCIGNLTSLRILSLSHNRLNSTIPTNMWHLKDLIRLDLSSNSFSGSLASEIGNLKAALQINLSMNQFSGFIPAEIGSLITLNNLSLSHNNFQGPVPESIAQMLSLEYLDLSYNNFSGKIPPSLQKLQHLLYFNVSFNDLSGEIPSGGPFINFSSQSFLSNKGLCGDSKYDVPPCPINPRKRSKRKWMLIVIIVSVLISTALLVLSIVYAFSKHKTKQVVSLRSLPWSIPAPLRFSYDELLEATDRYTENRLLGTGSFGSVYRATLRHGKDVAFKVFNLDSEGAYKSFEVESKILRELRHKNLCKVIGYCSTQNFRALVLQYMPRGSLEKWLYSPDYILDLLQRINIMIDVASALEYLHYGCSTPTIHCDKKPSNVLLDENMAAHLSDFGISKLLDEGETIITTTLATMGYIAPEFGTHGLVSTRCDVYSYGIMLMEVFTRMKPNNEIFTENLSLRSWVNDSMTNGAIHIVDFNMFKPNEGCLNEKFACMSSILKLALSCSMESPSERLDIKDARVALEKIKHQLHAYY